MRMLGRNARPCSFRGCTDNDAPGKARTKGRRTQKRRENQTFKADLRKGAHDD